MNSLILFLLSHFLLTTWSKDSKTLNSIDSLWSNKISIWVKSTEILDLSVTFYNIFSVISKVCCFYFTILGNFSYGVVSILIYLISFFSGSISSWYLSSFISSSCENSRWSSLCSLCSFLGSFTGSYGSLGWKKFT